MFEALTPSQFQLLSLAGAILVLAGLYYAGRLAGGDGAPAEVRVLCGWGVTVFLFTIASAAGPHSFHWYVLAFLILAGLGFLQTIYFGLRPGIPALFRILLLGLPMTLLIAAMLPTQWDDLTQWLPNARFLFEHNAFPRPDLPQSPSNFPAYPYGLPILVYLTSVIVGGFAENAGPIFNFAFILAMGIGVFRIATDDLPATNLRRWSVCAFAALFVTALNPTWVTRLTFSSYSDVGTSATFGITAGLTWLALNAEIAGQNRDARRLAWCAGLIACAVVGLRQANLVLMILLSGAFVFFLLLEREWNWRAGAGLLVRLLAAPLAVWLAWRWQVETRIGGGEFSFRPLDRWHTGDIPAIIGRMLSVASNKGGYFVAMMIASAIGVWALIRPRTPFTRLCGFIAIIFAGYNAFLLLAYVGAFSRNDALRVASYWRYNTHLGGVCLLFLAVAVRTLFLRKGWSPRPILRWVGPLAILLVVSAPVLLSKKLRFDAHPRYIFARDIGKELHEILSPNDRLMLVDPMDDGQYLTLVKYMLYGSAHVAVTSTAWNDQDAAKLRHLTAARNITHIWAYGSPAKLNKALNVRLPPESATLLHYVDNAWRPLKSWPLPGKNPKDS